MCFKNNMGMQHYEAAERLNNLIQGTDQYFQVVHVGGGGTIEMDPTHPILASPDFRLLKAGGGYMTRRPPHISM
jgi:hypothetical protein